ncbi:HlyD family secretion protein [Paraburkholderia gardini]|jgi:membrane fusion protein|uniref:Colicin V secretion protein CvaA n=1 Tax=Paraburkholderia gardini TaxID=2823469 RepID=A0ABM8U7F2_9BURK|nr:HlyD family efflux transporter periplasmic adaptor subunit [Paraburkholderia gardini]CAG4905177.1 Colicin V secretion protein CvaA [Paraburkholderia gardini]CAG4912205.1 Colicin V secretion protein CvaA [Paraburkholderia gardini]
MEPIDLPQFKDVSWRWIAYATSALVTVATAFAFFHEVELKQDVRAEIVSPSEIKIQGLEGLVADIYVHQAERVALGAPLFRLERDLSLASDGRPRPMFDEHMRDEQIASTEAQYRQRKAELSVQRETSQLTEASRRAEMSSLDEQLAQNRQLVDESAHKLSRLESVSEYVTADRIEQAKADTHQAKVVVAQSTARRQQLVAELGTARSAQAGIDAQLKELDARHARDLQDLRMRFEQNRQNMTISAPRAGTVSFSGLVAGRTLAASDVALVIVTGEGGALRAALRIPSRRRGFVREGQTVRLKFDAFPYAKFGSYEARIDSISRTTVRSPMSPPSGASEPRAPEGDYMAWATLRGHTFDFERQHFEILPGMSATASIVIERRTIAEWVLAPFFRMLRG